MGDEAFFATVREYLTAAQHSVVSPEDLISRMRKAAENQGDVDQLLAQWLDTPELPRFPL